MPTGNHNCKRQSTTQLHMCAWQYRTINNTPISPTPAPVSMFPPYPFGNMVTCCTQCVVVVLKGATAHCRACTWHLPPVQQPHIQMSCMSALPAWVMPSRVWKLAGRAGDGAGGADALGGERNWGAALGPDSLMRLLCAGAALSGEIFRGGDDAAAARRGAAATRTMDTPAEAPAPLSLVSRRGAAPPTLVRARAARFAALTLAACVGSASCSATSAISRLLASSAASSASGSHTLTLLTTV
mmetsp:Transcript_17507/g.37823  ORF Transcript_17507/g.37823 Transcript_17507/m.37823 type:complete len:242 (-) Transcript_17507:1906-2631(-)